MRQFDAELSLIVINCTAILELDARPPVDLRGFCDGAKFVMRRPDSGSFLRSCLDFLDLHAYENHEYIEWFSAEVT